MFIKENWFQFLFVYLSRGGVPCFQKPWYEVWPYRKLRNCVVATCVMILNNFSARALFLAGVSYHSTVSTEGIL